MLNADEIGLFWEQTGRKTLIREDADKAGAKIYKKRITVLLTAAMDGTLLAMEVVNQYLHPRAFSSIKQDLKRLPPCISWSASKKGWMTSDIFHTFLVKVNENFRVSNRNCVLFLDNFSGHKAGVDRCSINDLSNTRIEWLPANCTSICQPIDMGIGQAFKLRLGSFYTNTCVTKCSLTGLQQLAWTSCVCVCVDLLAAEAEIANPPMLEDHEQILNEVLVSSQDSDVTVPDEEDVVVIYDNEAVPFLTAKAATQALLELESFFQAQGKPADAEWCAVHACEVRKVADMLQKQSTISQFFAKN